MAEKKVGRPSLAELMHQKLDDIFDRHANGENLNQLCENHGITPSQFRARIRQDPALQKRWDEARKDYVHSLFDELAKLVKQLATDEFGKEDNAKVQALKAAIDGLKHITARLNPAQYGEQKAGAQGTTVIINTSLPIGEGDAAPKVVDGEFKVVMPLLEGSSG